MHKMDEITYEHTEMIRTEELTKVYGGGVKALDNVSFSVNKGEVFGFLGPNGAGKSTTIMILTTLLDPSGGKAYVNGCEVTKNRQQARMNLGYVAQSLSVDDVLTGEENLWLQAGFYNLSRDDKRKRLNEVLELVGLNERRGDLVETYSGGMRKRLDIAAGLIHHPRILFLDEPTLGLDTQTRREIWRYITRLREEVGMTIFVTTHYMEEADQICDRIGIIDQGRVIALDTPHNLKKSLGGDLITFSFSDKADKNEITEALKKLAAEPFIKKVNSFGSKENTYIAVTDDGEASLPLFFSSLEKMNAKISRVMLKTPSLDDVFVSFTGSNLREEYSHKEKGASEDSNMRRLRP